jgi:uncharacterized protein
MKSSGQWTVASGEKIEEHGQLLTPIVKEKFEHLKTILHNMESVLVAFSGGVDSTFLLRVAFDTLKGKAIALTATSPTYPEREFQEAKRLAQQIGAKHIIVKSNELLIPNFAENSDKRCYYCKSELFEICNKKAKELGIKFVADGSNADDLKDYRPGRDAAHRLDIKSPLIEAGLSKTEIRQISCFIGLETWKKPSFACLSSRFPYGTRITEEKLLRIERCEEIIRELGLSQFRVRYHNEIARIEVSPTEINRLLDNDIRDSIVSKFKALGFTYVTVDLQGYRTGSMNETMRKITA